MFLPCPCGKQLRVSESHIGRTVRCPGCGTPHVVKAGPTAAGPAQQARPALPPTRLPMLLRLAAILLLIGGVGFAGWWMLRPAAAGDEEGLYADAELIAILRPAELWAVPEVREAADEGMESPVTRFAGWTGLRPGQVERFALVAYRPAERQVWAVAHTVEPYDPALLNRNPMVDHGVFARQPYVVIQTHDRGRLALALVGPRTLVLGDEESLKTALGLRARRAVPGPLAALPALARGHQVAIGFNPSEGWQERLPALPVPGVNNLLSGVRGATLLLDVGERTRLTATAELTGEEREQTFNVLRKAQAIAGVFADDPFLTFLANGELRRDGDKVELKAEGESGPVLKALLGLVRKVER
jgi:hypothetical protein